MQSTISNQQTIKTYGEIDSRVETARKQGFEAGYKQGSADAAYFMKNGAFDDSPKSINHICDVCGNDYFGTDDSARSNGWDLGFGSEFCPECND